MKKSFKRQEIISLEINGVPVDLANVISVSIESVPPPANTLNAPDFEMGQRRHGFYRGEWEEYSGPERFIFRPYNTGADAAYWDGSRWWLCPPESALSTTDGPMAYLVRNIQDACLKLIKQGIEPTDDAVQTMLREGFTP